MLMTFALGIAAFAISAARSITSLLETAPDRITGSSVTPTFRFSPGKSACRFCCKRRDAAIDDDVVMPAFGGAPHDEADGAGALAIDQDFARAHDHGVRNLRVGDAMRVMSNSVLSTSERPAVSNTRSGIS